MVVPFPAQAAATATQSSSRRRAIFWLLVLLDGLLWLAAFTWRAPLLDVPPVVAVSVWPGSESFIAARESEMISSGTINFVEMGWSSPMMRAFGNHSVDAAILSLSEVAMLRDLGTPLWVMLAIADSDGADAMVVKPDLPDVKTVSDLKGRRVGVEVRSSGHYLLVRALLEAGLTLEDVEIVPINSPESETAFAEFRVDAVATADPWLARLQRRGGRVLCDSSQYPGEFTRVLAVRPETLDLDLGPLREMVDAHFRVSERPWKNLDPRMVAGIGRREGLPFDLLDSVMARISIHHRKDQAGLLTGEAPKIVGDYGRVVATLAKAGLTGETATALEVDTRLILP